MAATDSAISTRLSTRILSIDGPTHPVEGEGGGDEGEHGERQPELVGAVAADVDIGHEEQRGQSHGGMRNRGASTGRNSNGASSPMISRTLSSSSRSPRTLFGWMSMPPAIENAFEP